MKRKIVSVIDGFDRILAKSSLRLSEERNALLTFLFHELFLDEKEIGYDFVNAHQGITVSHFRQFVDYFSGCGYEFVSCEDILKGLDSDKKYVLITFDDGYFSQQYALSVLKEYKIPAVFFISTNNVKNNSCFWWDALYRQAKKENLSLNEICAEEKMLKSKTAKEIEDYLELKFGSNIFNPQSDIDRPFTAQELKKFSQEKYVYFGNHTTDHAILTNYSDFEIRKQISAGQKDMEELTGIAPKIISYPSGKFSENVIQISKELGMELGITVQPRKNYLPIDFKHNGAMRLGRFILTGNRNIREQCEVFRSDFNLKNLIKKGNN